MRLQTKYMVLKATTIFFGALSIPWSTFTGYCFGDGRYSVALASLAAQTVVALVDGYIWFWVLENMRNKIQGEATGSGNTFNTQREYCPFFAGEKALPEFFRPDYPAAWRIDTGKEVEKPEMTAGRFIQDGAVKINHGIFFTAEKGEKSLQAAPPVREPA